MGRVYTAIVPGHAVELDDNEIKLLLVAIRQVEHTFTIAETQSAAAGEPITSGYEGVRDAYQQLYEKLSALSGAPFIVR